MIEHNNNKTLSDFVTSFEESQLEGEFKGFSRTVSNDISEDVDSDKFQTDAQYNINNQEVVQTIITDGNKTMMKITVDNETVTQTHVESTDEFINILARNTMSSITT